MAITVYPIGKLHTLKIKVGEDTVTVKVKDLSYSAKSKILAATTKMQNGKVMIDYAKSCFLYLKHGLKDIEGIVDEAGVSFKLEIKDNEVTDLALEMLLSSDINNELIYISDAIGKTQRLKKIVDPITGEEIENIEILKTKDPIKKK